jgi:hypothetical protein
MEKAKGIIYFTFGFSLLKSRKINRKCVLCKSWLLKRDIHSDVNLLNDYSTTAKGYYQNYLRIYEKTLNLRLSKMSPLILKRNTNMREAILQNVIGHMIGVPYYRRASITFKELQ